jgi:hypothetical protein
MKCKKRSINDSINLNIKHYIYTSHPALSCHHANTFW